MTVIVPTNQLLVVFACWYYFIWPTSLLSYTLLWEGVKHAYVPALVILGYPLLPKIGRSAESFCSPMWQHQKTSYSSTEVEGNISSRTTTITTISQWHQNHHVHKVFVHCEAGINRSGTIVVAAMIFFAKISMMDPIYQLKRQRGIIMTNTMFQEQLVEFAQHQQQHDCVLGQTDDFLAAFMGVVRGWPNVKMEQ